MFDTALNTLSSPSMEYIDQIKSCFCVSIYNVFVSVFTMFLCQYLQCFCVSIYSIYRILKQCNKLLKYYADNKETSPTFTLSIIYGVSLLIQSECGKIRTRITPNTDTFHAVKVFISNFNVFSRLPFAVK